MISFCPTLAKPPVKCDLVGILDDIKDGRWEARVAAARAAYAAGDGERYARIKRSLPAMIFAGTFSARKKDALLTHSGLLCLDLDAGDNPGMQVEAMREIAVADGHTLAAFASPSGAGLKVLVAVVGQDGQPPRDADEHERCFRAAEAYYREALGLVVDPSGKDVCRLCFVSSDPVLWRSPQWPAEAFAPAPEAAPAPTAPAPQPTPAPRPGRATTADRAAAYVRKMPPAISGQHGHDALYAAALAVVVGFGLDQDEALAVLAREYNPQCQPPWSDSELRHKIADAARNAAGLPVGYLRDAPGRKPHHPARAADDAPAPAPAPSTPQPAAPPEQNSGPAPRGGIGAASVIPPPTGASVNPASLSDYPRSDDGNAMRMRDAYGDILRHTEAGYWACWDGARWRLGNDKPVAKLWRELVAQMRAASEQPDEIRWADKCGNAAPTLNMIKQLTSHDGIAVRDSDFDRPGDLLPVRNGLLDLRTGALRPGHDPLDLNTLLVDVDYDPDARSELWERFLADLCTPQGATGPDEALLEYLQEAAGYSLTPHISEQAVFMMVGAGRNGKSTFLDALTAVVGDYAGHVRTEVFGLRQQSANEAQQAIYAQRGRRLSLGTEIPGDMRLDEALIKTFTEHNLTGRNLYHDPVTYCNQTHLWLYGNHRPRVDGGDLGIWRRLKLIVLTSVIPADKVDVTLAPRLREPDAQRAILAWMAEGARKWYANGRRLAEPERVRAETLAWRRSEDKIGLFIEECCYLDPDDRWPPKLTEIYKAFDGWCRRCGIGVSGRPAFLSDICAWTGGAPTPPVTLREDGHGRKFLHGIALRSDWDEQ